MLYIKKTSHGIFFLLSCSNTHIHTNRSLIAGISFRTLPPEARLGRPSRVRIHHVPIDLLPPGLQKAAFPRHAVIEHPHVLPRVHAQQDLQLDPAGGQLGLVGAVAAKGPCILLGVLGGRHAPGDVGGQGVGVDGLFAVVGARQRGPRDVGRQDGEVLGGFGRARVLLDEPDVARAEHGVGGVQEGGAEGVEGGEGAVDVFD